MLAWMKLKEGSLKRKAQWSDGQCDHVPGLVINLEEMDSGAEENHLEVDFN